MEYRDFKQEGYIVDSSPVQRYGSSRGMPAPATYGVVPFAQRVKTVFILGTSTVTLIVVGYGIFTVRVFIPIIGILALLIAILLLLCAAAIAIISVVRYATRADYYGVEENGGYMRDALGRVRPLAPMIAAPAKVSRVTNKVEITPSVPSLFDLLENGEIAPGKLEMVMGYDKQQLEKGVLQIIIGAWPGTHAIAGRGRSGKTRRVIGEIAQVLISGGYVIVCDPHYAKADSLSRQLAPLEKYIRIARGEAEIVAASHDFLAEMTRRETCPDTNTFAPWAIYYDEWARLMTTEKIEDEDRAVLVEVAESCSEQYAGFNGFCALISQAWTSETCGGTRIRRGLQAAFVHQISPEYAAFFFRARKWQNRADEIKRRECIYKNGDSEIVEIITLGIPDDTAARVAVYLASIGMPMLEAPGQASASRFPEYIDPAQLAQGSRHAYLQIAAPLSPGEDIHPTIVDPRSPLPATDENEKPVIAPVAESEKLDPIPPLSDFSPVRGETFTIAEESISYTREQETAILSAAYQLARESNGRLTRSDIKERLGWNNKMYPILKAVCDAHNIAKQ